MSRISNLIKEASKIEDRNLSRELRKVALEYINKSAQTQQTGIFQTFRDDIMEYPTRQSLTKERGGEVSDKKYDLNDDKKEKVDVKTREYDRSLSTRYSPDRVGIQARRLADGIYQDPYTNKTYDWNEGFKTEDGQVFGGGSVALQSNLTDGK